jgi:RNA polymerase sigma factor (sigma-70 family)
MFLAMKVYSGVRIRTADQGVAPSRTQKLLGQRRMATEKYCNEKAINGDQRIRSGDQEKDRAKILEMRQPVKLEFERVAFGYREDSSIVSTKLGREYIRTPYKVETAGNQQIADIPSSEELLLADGGFIGLAQSLAPDKFVSFKQLRKELNKALKVLGPGQRRIMQHHFGLGGCREKDYAEIARLLGTTPLRIQKLVESAMRSLSLLNYERDAWNSKTAEKNT